MTSADAPGSAARPGGGAALDDLMLAMDVVDTLRHQERLVEAELSEAERARDLRARLRAIYEGQGLAVSDRILDEGIRALEENRFRYDPAPPGLARTLALAWIRRGRIGTGLALVVGLLAVVVGWTVFDGAAQRRAAEDARIELVERLPAELDRAAATASGIAGTPDANARIDELLAEGRAALAAGDATGARGAVAALAALSDELRRRYEIRVVSRPGTPSGVFRIPDANPDGRNYYLVVEAIGRDGAPMTLPVTSEEDGRTSEVAIFAIRVPEATFEAVRRDKAEDGIVQDALVGVKPVGALTPEWRMAVEGGAITSW